MPEQPPSPLVLALKYLRIAAGWDGPRLARALGVNRSLISAYESGKKPLTRGQLEDLIAPLGHPPEAVDVFLTAHSLIHPEPNEQAPSPVALTFEERQTMNRVAMAAGWSASRVAAEAARAEWVSVKTEEKTAAEEQKAKGLFKALITLNRRERRDVIEAFPKLRNWALAVRACEASVKSAAHKATEALEMAELAISIAERVAGEESWRSRLLGYCWAHVANARRVGNDLDGADQAIAQAWGLWQAGAASDPKLLGEWRLLSFEASLRRAQRRFTEALDLVKKARACEQELSPSARLNLLLLEESIYNQMGELRRAVATLTEAAPLCEASGDRQMLFALRFNMADNLCHLECYEEVAELLPQVRELAIQQANELDLIRVGWLTAKVAAGEGRTDEAKAGLEQVSQGFTARELPYDAALSSLDLSVLWLKAGRTAEVRKLADAMVWIFKAQGIAREALAALQVFCKAARQEAATVELARQVIADIEQARRSAPPPLHRGRGRS